MLTFAASSVIFITTIYALLMIYFNNLRANIFYATDVLSGCATEFRQSNKEPQL